VQVVQQLSTDQNVAVLIEFDYKSTFKQLRHELCWNYLLQ